MATSFKKTVVKAYPKLGEKITTDTLYWKKLELPITKKEYGAITHVEFCPVQPHYFAVTNATRVQIYSARSLQIHKVISRFKEVAYSGSFRDDGKLLVAGGDEGVIRLFDVEGKALLRVFKGHKGSVHTTKFLASRVQLLSGSDDNTVSIWDIPSEKEIVSYNEHKDYVRCGVPSKASKDIVLTGSYDHTVKLFDTRMEESVLSVDHGAPVESVLMFPTGGIFVSAGGNTVKVWDALAGGRLLTTLCHHHKTVTCLGFCSNYQRLMSGSLDRVKAADKGPSCLGSIKSGIHKTPVKRHVKIYDVGTYQVVHTLDYPGAILSLGVLPDDSLLAVGTAEGLLSIQKRKPEDIVVKKRRPVTYKFALKGKTYVPKQGDVVVEHKRKEKLPKYDKFFKKFEYTKALDAVLAFPARFSHPDVAVSVMQELIRRGGIKAALAGRSASQLKILIRFITRNIRSPRFMSTLTDVGKLLIDLYCQEQGRSSECYDLWVGLKDAVDQETKYMKTLYQVMGTMETLFAASAAAHTDSVNQNGVSGSHDLVLQPSLAAQNT